MNELHEPGLYTIRLKGHLNEYWAARFEGMTITLTAEGETCLTGPLPDQAALHGILRTVRDAGLALIAVNKEA
ncbi:MAG: hypothetical protein OHK0046_41620 [Anaerolineae bacterium]